MNALPGDDFGLDSGLTDDEAGHRLRIEGPNALPETRSHRWLQLIRNILLEPMFLMLLVAAAIYAALGDRGEAALLLGSVVIVVAITAAQEFRAEGALRALRELAAPVAHVIRSGNERTVPATHIVRGDVLVLREGDRVAADGCLRDGFLTLDESLLTGESVPVTHEPSDRKGDVRAGTLVVGGHGRVEVTATGAATAFGVIGKSLSMTESAPSALQRAAGRAVRLLAVIAMTLAAMVALLGWKWGGLDPLHASLGGIALAMAILPEEVPVVLTVFYALGARRIARHGVLTRRLAAVETMGAISALAVDKTGTLTKNRMALAMLVDANGDVHEALRPLDPGHLRLLEAAYAATSPMSLDPTDGAVRQYVTSRCPMVIAADAIPVVREFSVGDGRPFVSRVIPRAEPGTWYIATKGASEAVLPLCGLDAGVLARMTVVAAQLAAGGFRVLAVARSHQRDGALPVQPATERHELMGMIGLADPLRDDVPSAMAECHAAGIRVLMLTGDHPATAAAIARQAGLRGDRLLTGTEIDRLDDDSLDARLREVDVCARVQPAQKLRLVRSLQRDGHIVGMTGDGVNDAPALRAADVGVAMGERGSDVAREAADLVLLNDSFVSLVMAIRLGRRIYDNVHRAIRFISAAHVPIVILALVPLLIHQSPLLLPAQIVLLEMIIDPACSIVFEATPTRSDVMGRPPRLPSDSPFSPMKLARGLLDGIGVGVILALAYLLPMLVGVSPAEIALPVFLGLLACTVTLVIVGQRKSTGVDEGAPWASALVLLAMAIAGVVAVLPRVREAMGFAEPSWLALVVPALCVGLTLGWLRLLVVGELFLRRDR